MFLVACYPGDALAFKTDGKKWTANRTVLLHLSLGSGHQLQDGFTSFNESAADALNLWNQHLAHLRFSWLTASALPPGDGDGNNSVFFSNKIFGDSFGTNVLAVTLTTSRDTVITETDVIFNTAVSFDSYRGPQQGSTHDFHRVALHEFGHVLSLDHPDEAGQRVNAIMNSRVSSLDSLQSDDIAGARSIYDNGPSYLSAVPAPALLNLSTRAFVGTGNNVLIGGFIIQGTEPATVVLRAIGNSLSARGVSNPLNDPQIELFNSSGTLVSTNDDWISSSNAATIASYGLDPTNSLESAILRTLNPGSYTVVLKAFDNQDGRLTGTALVELYDVHTTGGRVGNISTRGQVLSGNDILIGGFIVGPGASKPVVVRALGPSLRTSGITNAIPDPRVELRDGNGSLVRENDDWQNDPDQAAVIRAAGLAPSDALEAALHTTLAPGQYTATVREFDGRTGIGLVEVYDLSPVP